MSTSDSRHRSSPSSSQPTTRKRRVPDVTEARSRAQRIKLDARAYARQQDEPPQKSKSKQTQQEMQAKRRALTTIARVIDDYLQDHEGGNHNKKTLEWHIVALCLLRSFLQEEREITKALSEIPRSRAIADLLFPLVSTRRTAFCLNSLL